MTRTEVYKAIREYGIEEYIKNKYGKNYTNLPTSTLEEALALYEDSQQDADDEEEDDEQISAYKAACLAFLGILKDSGSLEELLDELND